jgi:NADPH-dependent 2,4-dienoyl-CoA reductase/sulfur reductase-like enzyme
LGWGAILEKPAPGDRDVAGLFRTFADGARQEVIMAQSERVDVLVLGSGEAGKYLAWHMAHAGHRTAVVERQWVGGSCPNINCLPSKNEIWSATRRVAPS